MEAARAPDNRVHPVPREAHMMLQQIEELLNAEAPTLASLESTLTDGYARALALEAERLRLERRLSEVARAGAEDGAEVSTIGSRLNRTDAELGELRKLLGSLHARARRVRRR
jgi:hypothetical protein